MKSCSSFSTRFDSLFMYSAFGSYGIIEIALFSHCVLQSILNENKSYMTTMILCVSDTISEIMAAVSPHMWKHFNSPCKYSTF